jgi:hypothetical protein
MRFLENPVRRLVDFYAGILYPGVLTEDGSELPEGIQSAIPFSKDTPPALRSAIAQIWMWSNWQAKKSVEVRYGAALGDVFVEVVDDIESGKVYLDVLWPGFICELERDKSGNVKSYSLEYRVEVREQDDRGRYRTVNTYMYRKDLDQHSIKYYRDDSLVSSTPNPYGFAPAVWIPHSDCGTDHGACAFAGSMEKIDELNSRVSGVGDQIRKAVENPRLMSTNSPQMITRHLNQDKRPATSQQPQPSTDQESVLIMTAPADTKVQSLLGDLNIADAGKEIDRLEAEIERSHPELSFYHMLREMTQLTGPAADRVVGDVKARVYEAMAAYDQANISLFRMATAIAGMRLQERAGGWSRLDNQQQKFASFNLDSYAKGNLDMAIMPRPILTPTKTERAQEKQAVWNGVNAAIKAGVPLELVLEDEGWTEQQIAKLVQAKQAEEAKQQQQFEQQQATMQKFAPKFV